MSQILNSPLLLNILLAACFAWVLVGLPACVYFIWRRRTRRIDDRFEERIRKNVRF